VEHHVLTREGDATPEVEAVLRGMRDGKGGLYRYFYVTRANQTVVMTESTTSPLAEALRSRGGWREPGMV
jgi:hypothetical protein